MSKRTTKSSLRKWLWTRLSADPDRLDLNDKINEQPEDLFVRLAHAEKRKEVVEALLSLLVENLGTEPDQESLESKMRFLRRAIRLCDVLDASECRNLLELLVLKEEHGVWKEHLAELQELAARVLSGFAKKATDLEMWCHVAERRNAALPYALNSVIEIDIGRGIDLVARIYLNLPAQARAIADWGAILRIAEATHGVKALGKALSKAMSGRSISDFEEFVQLAGLPELRKYFRIRLGEVLVYRDFGRAAADSYVVEPSRGRQYGLTETVGTRTAVSEMVKRPAAGTSSIPGAGSFVSEEPKQWANYFQPLGSSVVGALQ